MMGIIDLGRAVYQLNGVSAAARELARATSVHPGASLGGSTETSAVLGTQRRMIPGLTSPSFSCVDITGASVTGSCQPGSWVQVSLNSTFIPVTPVASFLGTIVLTGHRQRRESSEAPSCEQRLTGWPDRADRGQVLVVFALSFLVLLGFAGLAMDGGSTFAQRRNQQTAADLAALAAANDYLINGALDAAVVRAQTVAASNGFTHGMNGTTVDTTLDTSNGISVTVDLEGVHRNMVVAVLGMPTWNVSTTATALAGFPDTAYGAGAFIFSASAFNADGTPLYTTPTDFGEGNGDVPTGPLDISWTNYGTGNVNTSEVSAIISGSTVVNKQLDVRRVHRPAQQRQPHGPLRRREHPPGGPRLARPGRRRQRQLHGLVDLPRHQRGWWVVEAHPGLLPDRPRERAAGHLVMRRQWLPAVPRLLHPEARQLRLAGPRLSVRHPPART